MCFIWLCSSCSSSVVLVVMGIDRMWTVVGTLDQLIKNKKSYQTEFVHLFSQWIEAPPSHEVSILVCMYSCCRRWICFPANVTSVIKKQMKWCEGEKRKQAEVLIRRGETWGVGGERKEAECEVKRGVKENNTWQDYTICLEDTKNKKNGILWKTNTQTLSYWSVRFLWKPQLWAYSQVSESNTVTNLSDFMGSSVNY